MGQSLPDFGQYRLEGLVGTGGMGEVHRAWDARLGRRVAVKIIKGEQASSAEYRERFRRECGLAARLKSPHILPIHDFGEIDGDLFLAMPLVDGGSLADVILESGPLPLARAVEIVGQVAKALDVAHAAGLVHRDVKPSNILLDRGPGGEAAYLIDFGIVRSPGDTQLTPTSRTIGTTAYMAPEAFDARRDVDQRADVYALGCVLFEALTGHRPFLGDDRQMMYGHTNLAPPRVRAERTDIPPELDEALARSLAKDPVRRWAGAGEFARAVRRAVDPSRATSTSVPFGAQQTYVPAPGPYPGTPPGPFPPPAPSQRVSPAAVIAVAVGVVLVLLVAVSVAGRATSGPTVQPTTGVITPSPSTMNTRTTTPSGQAPASAVTVRRTSTSPIVLNSGYRADLDSLQPNWEVGQFTDDLGLSIGKIISESGADIAPVTAFGDYTACSGATAYGTQDLTGIEPGDTFCVRTTENRFASVRVVSFSEDQASFDAVVWDPPFRQ